MPNENGKISSLVSVMHKVARGPDANNRFISYNVGKTTDGKDFESYLGSDGFEDMVAGRFDDFLHECFSKYMNQEVVMGN